MIRREEPVLYPTIVVIFVLLIVGLIFKDAILYQEVVPMMRHPWEETRYRSNRITGSLEKLEKYSDRWVYIGNPRDADSMQ